MLLPTLDSTLHVVTPNLMLNKFALVLIYYFFASNPDNQNVFKVGREFYVACTLCSLGLYPKNQVIWKK